MVMVFIVILWVFFDPLGIVMSAIAFCCLLSLLLLDYRFGILGVMVRWFCVSGFGSCVFCSVVVWSCAPCFVSAFLL